MPWQDLKVGTKKQFPNAFGFRALRFDDKPDYSHLRKNFRNLFICEDYNITIFNWNIQPGARDDSTQASTSTHILTYPTCNHPPHSFRTHHLTPLVLHNEDLHPSPPLPLVSSNEENLHPLPSPSPLVLRNKEDLYPPPPLVPSNEWIYTHHLFRRSSPAIRSRNESVALHLFRTMMGLLPSCPLVSREGPALTTTSPTCFVQRAGSEQSWTDMASQQTILVPEEQSQRTIT